MLAKIYRFPFGKGLLIAILFCLSVFSDLPAQKKIAGVYTIAPQALKKLPAPGSLDKVKVIEVFSISCHHCYNFFKSSAKFKKAFGDKVDLKILEIGWVGDNLSRFIYTAENHQKDHAAQQLLFSAFHDAGSRDLNNPKLLDVFAAELQLPKGYKQEMRSSEVSRKIVNAAAIVSRFKVSSTPTFIVDDVILVKGADVDNLAKVINSLLKKPVKF